jgi:polysaccharide export outer membrane protein
MLAVPSFAQVAGAQPPTQATSPQQPGNGVEVPTGVVVPPGFVIGPEDVLTIVFWRDKELSAEVVVRPDGKISLPLLNDVQAAGYTPDQLREELVKAASKYIEAPTVSVVVKAINSRRVFIMGQVGKAGPYPIFGDLTIVQLIAQAGGLLEYADEKKIQITRTLEGGQMKRFFFNYKDFVAGKNLAQNIALKPGDVVIVP